MCIRDRINVLYFLSKLSNWVCLEVRNVFHEKVKYKYDSTSTPTSVSNIWDSIMINVLYFLSKLDNSSRELPNTRHCIIPQPTSHKAGMLKSLVDKGRLRHSTLYSNGNERNFWKIVKKIRNGRTELIFFTSRYNPRLNVKKISASYVHSWFFYNFSKIAFIPI